MKKQEFIDKYGESRYLEWKNQQKEWRVNHRQEINEKKSAYRKAHRWIVNAEKKRYYEKHKDNVLMYNSLKKRLYRTVGFTDLTQIENYLSAQADNFKGWVVHHRFETHTSDGVRRLIGLTREELIAFGMYRDRPPEELIWMKASEHMNLHFSFRRDTPPKNISQSAVDQHAASFVCTCEIGARG